MSMVWFAAGATCTKGGAYLIGFGLFVLLVTLVTWNNATRKKEGRPPWADRHDAIDRKHRRRQAGKADAP